MLLKSQRAEEINDETRNTPRQINMETKPEKAMGCSKSHSKKKVYNNAGPLGNKENLKTA